MTATLEDLDVITADLVALNALGSADAIAETLLAAGFTGRRRCGGACPLAEMIHHNRPGIRVTVSGSRIYLRDLSGEVIKTPIHVHRFIQLFDLGHYPALDATTQP